MTAAIVSLPRRDSTGADLPAQEPLLPPPAPRLYWRAVVRTGSLFAASREGDRVEWHLAACDAPHTSGQHCPDGLRLMDLTGQPGGHCMVDGRCGLCGAVPALEELARAA